MTPIHPQGIIKAPVNSHTTRAVGADRDGAPGQSEGERARQEYVEKVKVVTSAKKF